jgi:hypothetical protein
MAARRREQFIVTVRKNFQANRIQWAHLTFCWLVLAVHSLQTSYVGEPLQFFLLYAVLREKVAIHPAAGPVQSTPQRR